MTSYTIGETAERSGFSASALRYYEDIGLVVPERRTPAGYRVYGDDALARLAFVARAKQLGCTLEEITDLVEIWDGDECGPVQLRFHALVTEKIRATEAHIADLVAFASQLQVAATRLGDDPIDGPCGPGCACLGEPFAAGPPVPVALGPRPDVDPAVPVACTLDAGSVQGRLREWHAVLDHVEERAPTADGGLRLAFGTDVPLVDLARLVQAEQACCAFFSFALTVDARGTALEVRAPADADDVVATLFGVAA